jgi:hypothetical protein
MYLDSKGNAVSEMQHFAEKWRPSEVNDLPGFFGPA